MNQDLETPAARPLDDASEASAKIGASAPLTEPRKLSDLNFPGPHWAVFNEHVNDAGARALAICRLMFDPDEPELMHLEACHANGIMRIFQHSPGQVCAVYGALCFAFVNELEKRPAQGIEARQGGDAVAAPSLDESPVAEGDAP